MEHGLELIIPILEILEIEVCSILYNPKNIRKRSFQLPHILNILEIWFFQFSHILEILEIFFSIFWDFYKKDARRNFTQYAPTDEPRSLIWDRFRPKTKTVLRANFQVTAAATTSQQLFLLASALDHHAQGPIIPFGVNPSLRYVSTFQKVLEILKSERNK